MARINIEDTIYRDSRFFDLAQKVGSREAAMGSLVFAWDLAQRWWKTPDKKIPLEEWGKIKNSSAILDVGLAEMSDGKVYLRGSREQFVWLEQRQNAGRKNKGKSSKRPLTGRNDRQRVETSSSPSPSPSMQLSKDSSKEESSAAPSAATESGDLFPVEILEAENASRVESPQQKLIAKYCELFKAKYGTNPVIRVEELGVSKTLVKLPGLQRCLELLPAFFEMQIPRHPLYQFSQQISAVAVKHETGRVVSNVVSRADHAVDHAKDQLRRIAEGRL